MPTIRTLRRIADERPAALAPLVPGLVPFLADERRAIRLSAAKLFVAVAAAAPESVHEAIPALAAVGGDATAAGPKEGIGSLAAIRVRTDEVEAGIAGPEAGCPRCGLALPDGGPPTCPRCGAPYRR
ncbi:MAG: hypothetical protein M8354_02860 [Halalkalicoccus sp.]|nr:hypothetical protein [Halalkalicoccus sp.]